MILVNFPFSKIITKKVKTPPSFQISEFLCENRTSVLIINTSVVILLSTSFFQSSKMSNIKVSEDVVELCTIIETNGDKIDDKTSITFGKLFDLYENISENLVAFLRRAKKFKFVDFEGEMLFQGKDNETRITLLKSAAEVKQIASES